MQLHQGRVDGRGSLDGNIDGPCYVFAIDPAPFGLLSLQSVLRRDCLTDQQNTLVAGALLIKHGVQSYASHASKSWTTLTPSRTAFPLSFLCFPAKIETSPRQSDDGGATERERRNPSELWHAATGHGRRLHSFFSREKSSMCNTAMLCPRNCPP